jgi:glycosyltransferase involved in cell wall biosynthesis
MSIKLLVACPWGPATSPKTISGVACYLIPQLKQHFDVVVADTENSPFATTPLERLQQFGRRCRRRLLQPPPPVFPGAHRNTTRKFSTWLNARIEQHRPEAVLTFGYAPVVQLRRPVPTYIYVDYAFQFKALAGIFDWITPAQFSEAELRALRKCDRAGLRNSRQVFTTSLRIAEGIAHYYPEFADKLVSAGIGANLEGLPTTYTPRTTESPNLIFISTNFERKGGYFALELFRILKAKHPGLHLHLIGDHPSDLATDQDIVVHGWIDKSSPAGYERICQLLAKAHLHILPTRGDLTPHSICEMNAFSIPTISRAVGGIPDLVENGVSGRLVKEDTIAAWQVAVEDVLANHAAYSAQAFQKYQREQTWKVVASRIARQIASTK